MSTHSTIAIKQDNGIIKSVYCHYDGYLSHNGIILLENYKTVADVENLIQHGGLLSLGKEIGHKHEFNNPYDFGTEEYKDYCIEFEEKHIDECEFYHRDRNEDLIITEFDSIKKMLEKAREYTYLFCNDKWHLVVKSDTKPHYKLVELTKEMCLEDSIE